MTRLPFPLRGFLYELRRGLLNPALFAITVLLVVISMGIVTTFHVASGRNYESCEEVAWYVDGAYHFVVHVHDQHALPIAGVLTNISLSTAAGSPGSPPIYFEGHTAPNGSSQLVARLPVADYVYSFFAIDPNASSSGWGEGCLFSGGNTTAIATGPPGSVHSLAWGTWTLVGLDSSIPSPQLLLFFLGPNGTSPTGDQAFWAGAFNASGRAMGGPNPFPPLPESAMHRLGTFRGDAQVFSFAVPNATWTGCYSCTSDKVVQLEIFSPTGQILLEDTNLSASDFAPVPTGLLVNQADSLTFSFMSEYVGLIAPFMAIVAAYALYARDRISGVLETTQCGPISREGLALSRWAAVLVTLAVSLVVSLAVISVEIHSVLGVYLPASVLLATLGAVLVEVGAFSGLVMLLSRFSRSHVVVLGTAFGLFLGFEVGWTFLDNFLISYVQALPGGSWVSAQSVANQFELLNPLGTLFLLSRIYVNPPLLGVTQGEIGLAGFLWVMAPLVLFVLHARMRD
ncbi:MAG: ABC transporter permease [Euryarchaeota archaeon]|nr:ABC transporter permease [Euryarchaeota archaeon]MDE1837511.1 ABC transporter permease [Euryarchaeota archaeon]MDE1882025.1 ABC transporter permease [Euryarchaeota archaeon]MDE2045523.1 ABC transporter permease [Thermoplasmata archaeon]